MIQALLILILCAANLAAQSTTAITLAPKQEGATGTLKFKELYANGNETATIQAPTSITTTYAISLPSALPFYTGCWKVSPAGISTVAGCGQSVNAEDYNWSQSIGNIAAGTRTITATPCRVNASDTTQAIKIADGVSSEVAFLTGTGTCTAGATTGTIQVVLLNSYTGATISSASDGVQEAINTVAAGNVVTVFVKNGTYSVASSILTGTRYVSIECESQGAIFIPTNNNVAVFSAASASGIRVSNCAFNNTQSKTGTKGIYTYNPTGSSFGTVIDNVAISNFAYGMHLATAYAVSVTRTQVNYSTVAALKLEQVETGDAGTGLISGNIFVGDTGYGIEWNGPGNLKVHGNSFNGFVEQIHLEPTMGTVNVSGTSVTWVSGNKFRSSWSGVSTLVASSTVSSLISSVNSDVSITLATSQPSCTGCRYYVGVSGQLQIMNNTMDGGANTTHGIRAVGDIPFFNFQINGNFFANYTNTSAVGIELNESGFYFGSVQHNNVQSSVAGTTVAVSVVTGSYITVANNQIANHKTGVSIGSAAVGIKTHLNNCADLVNTTNCILNAASTSLVNEISPMTFAQVTALSAAAGSTMYCSDCKPAPTTNACVGSGSGAFVQFVQGTKVCRNASEAGAQFIFGGNSFGTTGILGTNDAFGLAFKTNNTIHWTMQTDGTWYTTTDGGPSIGAGGANRPNNGYFKNLVQAGSFGTSSNCSDAAGTIDCGAAAAGSFALAAGTTTIQVNTTAVGANSQIFIQNDPSLSTRLGVTCNTTFADTFISSRGAGVGFIIQTSAAPVTNPRCYNFFIVN